VRAERTETEHIYADPKSKKSKKTLPKNQKWIKRKTFPSPQNTWAHKLTESAGQEKVNSGIGPEFASGGSVEKGFVSKKNNPETFASITKRLIRLSHVVNGSPPNYFLVIRKGWVGWCWVGGWVCSHTG
jgi:hypothetical protein